jgi:hypothetical protein
LATPGILIPERRTENEAAMERLTQLSGQLAGKVNPGGREKILQKNPDDVSLDRAHIETSFFSS